MIIRIGSIEKFAGIDATLSDEEEARLATFGSEKRRREFMAGRALLRRVSDEYFPIGPRGELLQSEGGTFASISHSGEFVICALAAEPLGVDIEIIRPRRNYRELLRLAGIRREGEISMREFYTLWTRFEAGHKLATISDADPSFASEERDGYMISLAHAGREKIEMEIKEME